MKIKLEYEIDFDIQPYINKKRFVDQKTISEIGFVNFIINDSSAILCDITNDINRQIKEAIEKE